MQNKLYYGDNLPILRQHIANESVDLIYLDPPFNSNRNYNVLFKDESGHDSEAQMTAFEDTWHWNQAAENLYQELITNNAPSVSSMISALREFIGANQMMAYLVMMAARLVELHRVLKPTGSLYLHCDPTASHYLKILLDTILGVENFRGEIVWKRSSAHNDATQGMKQPGRVHDVIFFYSKGKDWKWNSVFTPYDQEYLTNEYRHKTDDGRYYKETDLTAAKPGGDTSYEWHVKRLIDKKDRWQADVTNEYRTPVNSWEYKVVTPYEGRYWAYSKENMLQFSMNGKLIHRETGMPRLAQFADEMPGISLQDLWDDISPIGAKAAERLGYPTQKPLALLERIINASSNPGDIVLDPFCGCGTAIAAAQKLGRQWIGIDITHLSIALQKYRLKDMFGLEEKKDYAVVGEPEDLDSARQLANDDRYQFQWWALSLIKARPLGGDGGREGKKGSDKGIDGIINFIDDSKGKPKRVIVQVKSGKVKSGDIRDLRGVIDREGAAIGVFVTLDSASKDMKTEAATVGVYNSQFWGRTYPKLQILTIEDLLRGKTIDMPQTTNAATFKQAEKVQDEQTGIQKSLFDN